MGATKTDTYSEKQMDISLKSKALGHPARIAIIDYLIKVNTCICGDIVNELPLAQPTVSHHMKQLVDAGLVTREQRGKWAYYALVPEALAMLSAVLDPWPSRVGGNSSC